MATGTATTAASGTWGTCEWTLDSDGVLTVHGGTAASVSGWDMSNAAGVNGMFSGCSNLASIDLSEGDMRNVKETSGSAYGFTCMLFTDASLKSIKLGKYSVLEETADSAADGVVHYSYVCSPASDSTCTGYWVKLNSDSIQDHSSAVTASELMQMYTTETAAAGTGEVATWVWEEYDADITFDSNDGSGSMDDLLIVDSTADTTL